MAIYTIKDLEKLSGIKAHTIRIWEQRYGILDPQRTPTNIRYYQDDDLKLLLNVALLNRNGYKISKIAKMSTAEITEKVSAISEINFGEDAQLDVLTLSMIEMDSQKFDRILSANIEQLGFEKTMLEVVYPFLAKLNVLWLSGSVKPVQVNFISYLIRQKIIAAIDGQIAAQQKDAPTYLLYLPEGERQELILLFMDYLLRSRQNQVIYLGQDISLNDLKDANDIHQADYVFTMISETFAKEPIQQYVDHLSEIFPHTKVMLSGYQIVAQYIEPPENVILLRSLQETLDFVNEKILSSSA